MIKIEDPKPMEICARHKRYYVKPFCPDCQYSVEAVRRKIDRLLNMGINHNPGSVARALKEIAAILTELNDRNPHAIQVPPAPDPASDHNHLQTHTTSEQ